MIRADLPKYLNQWKLILKNFTSIISEVRNTADKVKICLKARRNIEVDRQFKSITDGSAEQKIAEFISVVSEVEKLQNSSDTFSSGFVELIVENFININFNTFNYLQTSQVNTILIELKELREKNSITPGNVNTLYGFITNFANYIQIITRISFAYRIFEKLKFIKTNIVLIGANGSGKSTFSRNLRGILSKQITVIPSQQLLYYKAPYSINTGTNYVKSVLDYQIKDKLGNSNEIKDSTQDDFTNLIIALKEDEDI